VTQSASGGVHVYTGDGKGKTTAAFGLAMRASGRGLSVLIIQFMKGRSECGENVSAKRLPNVKVEQYGSEDLVCIDKISDNDRAMARKAFKRAEKAVKTKEVDLLILDEANVAVHFGLITVKELLDLIDAKPAKMDIVITGRYAKPEIIAEAEYVTEMLARKHPYNSGKKARPGIES
jgi:cob(I)alamin adenosyltransferase